MRPIKTIFFLILFAYTMIWATPAYAASNVSFGGPEVSGNPFISQNPTEKKLSGYSGSGFFITPNVIVTCNHVINGARSIEIVYNNEIKLSAVVIGSDKINDLALLRVTGLENVVSPLLLGDSDSVREGSRVYAVGFPLPMVMGTGAKVSEGIISSNSGLLGDVKVLQISTPIQPGNSGGPLLNEQAEVVGVVSSGLNGMMMMKLGIIPQNVNYAVKINNLRNLICDSSLSIDIHEPLYRGSLSPTDVMDSAKKAVVLILVMK